MPKGQLPGTSFQQGKKSFKKALLDGFADTQKEVISIKRDMNEEIEKRINERLGDHIKRLEGLYADVMLQKKIFFDKGLISREELSQKYKELKKKK